MLTPDERKRIECMPTCYGCGELYGTPHWIEAVVSDEVWEKISPLRDREAGILCIKCIARRCAADHLVDVPVKITAGPLKNDEWVRLYEIIGRQAAEIARLNDLVARVRVDSSAQ